ncbi:MAG: 7TM diverse intracellular signaling domain-containing protein [Altererythrobacter sp.]
MNLCERITRWLLTTLSVGAILLFAQPVKAEQLQHRIEFELASIDNPAQAGIEDLCCTATGVQWEPATQAPTSFMKPVLWLRLPPIEGGTVLEIPQMVDRATLFERPSASRGEWSEQLTGDTVSLSQRAMPTAEMAFELAPGAAGTIDRYLRLEQPSSVAFSIDVWKPADFARSTERRLIVQILLFGFCAAMIVFNFVVALVTRERIFAYNAATISCTMVIAIYLTGQAGVYLWPQDQEWNYIALVLAMGGLSLFATRFISAFLAGGPINPRLLTFNRWFGAAQFAVSVLVLILMSHSLYAGLLLVGLLSMGYQLFLVFTSIFKGDRQAIPLLIPLSILIAGITVRWARTALSLDLGWANYHIMEIALALEAITFSLVLAGRIRFFAARASEAEHALDRHRLEAAERFSNLQDHERSRMAGDLHDSIGHSLAMAVGQLERASTESGLSEDTVQRLAHVQANVREAISETRRISHALHPARLDHLGMAKGLQSLFDDLDQSRGIASSVEIECPDDALDNDETTQITRIVQEAVSNIARHSKATSCSFTMKASDGGIAIGIEDNGIGDSAPSAPDGDTHLGLVSIEQRVLRLGGSLAIDRTPGSFRLGFSFVPRGWRAQ